MTASNNKDTDQPTKTNEQLEQQSKSYKSDEEFQENKGQVNADEELHGSNEHLNIDEESQGNDGHLNIHELDQTVPLTLQSTFKPKKDHIIQFYTDEDGEPLQVAKIVSRAQAGKVTGQYEHWYNIEYIKPDSKSGEVSSLDIS